METHFVLYRSKARTKIAMETTIDILATSVRNNREEGLTGFLHTDNDHFLQYLEGPHGPLMRKLASIRKDRRHSDFLILAEGVVGERLFPDWDMGQMKDVSSVFDGTLQKRSWLRPRARVNPLPLLEAVAAHAGKAGQMEIYEE